MRNILFAAFALLFAGTVAYGDSRHYEAQNCEVYVEKIQLVPGSYQTLSAQLYLRSAVTHLDGDIKAIGMRVKSTTRDRNAETIDWHDVNATKVVPFGEAHQWRVTLPLEAWRTVTEHEAVFFLQTTRDTWFWLHPNHDGEANFFLSTKTFEVDGQFTADELWVNDYDTLLRFNPARCQ